MMMYDADLETPHGLAMINDDCLFSFVSRTYRKGAHIPQPILQRDHYLCIGRFAPCLARKCCHPYPTKGV